MNDVDFVKNTKFKKKKKEKRKTDNNLIMSYISGDSGVAHRPSS